VPSRGSGVCIDQVLRSPYCVMLSLQILGRVFLRVYSYYNWNGSAAQLRHHSCHFIIVIAFLRHCCHCPAGCYSHCHSRLLLMGKWGRLSTICLCHPLLPHHLAIGMDKPQLSMLALLFAVKRMRGLCTHSIHALPSASFLLSMLLSLPLYFRFFYSGSTSLLRCPPSSTL
jgi:hypothetical protein